MCVVGGEADVMFVWWEVRQTYRVVLLLPGVGMVGGGLGTVSIATAVRVLCSHREEEEGRG